MVKILQLLSITSATATGDDDRSSLLQMNAPESSKAHHILDAVSRGEDSICVKAAAGDVAPVAGSFTAKMSQQLIAVAAGSIAKEDGSFCVPKQEMLLLQRTYGLNTAHDFDAALSMKGGEEKEPQQTLDSTTVSKKSVGQKNVKSNYNDVGYPDMGNEAAIVGDGGLVLRYIDDSWVRQDYGPQCQNCLQKKGDLLGVGFPDEGKGIRAVGKNGLWLQFKPSADGTTGSWEQELEWVGLSDAEKTTLAGIDLHAVQFPDSGIEVMAVGTDGYVLRWLGSKWKLEKVGSSTLKAISSPDEGDGYGRLVAGSNGEVYMQMGSNDNATWVRQTVPAGPQGEVCDFEDVRYDQDQGTGAGFAIAAGSHGMLYQITPTKIDKDLVPIAPATFTLLKKFDFTVYTIEYQGKHSIKVAGAGGNIWESTSGVWKETAKSRNMTQSDIYRSFLSDQGDVLSLVGANNTIIRYSSGNFVNAEYEDHGTNLESVAFPDEGGEAVAVGRAGTILEVKNDIWKAVNGGTKTALGSHHLKCVAMQDSGTNAIAVGMGGAVLERISGKWSRIAPGERSAAYKFDKNMNGCAFGESAAGNPFVAVGDGGHILSRRADGQVWMVQQVGCNRQAAGPWYGKVLPNCNLNAVAFNDAGTTRIAVGSYGKIWRQHGNGIGWGEMESPTTKHLYAIAFKDGQDLDEAIIVGAEGTALVYGKPEANKWNLYCKGVVKGGVCVAEGDWMNVKEDLKSVTYLDAENDDSPQKEIAVIVGNKGTFVQWGFNAGHRQFYVMRENGSTDKNLNSITVSDKGAFVFVVGDGTDVDGKEPEATIIRKTGQEIWNPESLKTQN